MRSKGSLVHLVTLTGSALVAAAGLVMACVGDDPGTTSTSVGDAAVDAPGTDATSTDVSLDAGPLPPACKLSAPFGAPTKVLELSTAATENSAHLTHDELTIYFSRGSTADAGVVGAVGREDLFTASRTSRSAAFGAASPLSTINAAGFDAGAQSGGSPSGDHLTLYFGSDRDAAVGNDDLYLATRGSTLAAFDNVTSIASLNTANREAEPYVMPDDTTIYFMSSRTGSRKLYRATRPLSGAFSIDTSGVLDLVNAGASNEDFATVTIDELRIYFSSDRPGGPGIHNIWTATRSTKNDPFSAPTLVSELNAPGTQNWVSWISDDGCRIYLANRSESWDIFVAAKPAP